MPNEVPKDQKPWTEFIQAGSAYQVIKAYKKAELNANGEMPVFIRPEVVEKKKKNPLSSY